MTPAAVHVSRALADRALPRERPLAAVELLLREGFVELGEHKGRALIRWTNPTTVHGWS